MESPQQDKTGPSSPKTPVTPRQDGTTPSSSAPLMLELPTLPELVMPFAPPTPEEKIAYDPSALQLPSKDSPVTAGLPSTTFKTDRNEQRSMDRKPLPIEPVEATPSWSVTTSPDRAGPSLPEPFPNDCSLPEVVTPEMQADIKRQEVIRREKSVRSLKPEASQPYTPQGEQMTITPSNFDTVTPLHLLGDQPDVIDCPFCLRRSQTKIVREASALTHVFGGLCCLTTLCGVIAPYKLNWSSHVDQQCTNCNRRVTRMPRGTGETVVFGTPLHLREVSRYPAAESRPNDEIAPPPPAKS